MEPLRDLDPDREPIPWWPCPNCGAVHWLTLGVFEKDAEFGGRFTGWTAGGLTDESKDQWPICFQCKEPCNLYEVYGWG